MKRLILIASLFAACASQAVTYKNINDSFINNGTYVCLPNNTTNTFYPLGSGTNLTWFQYALGTNVLSGSTNSFGQQLAPTFIDVPLVPDGNGDVNPTLGIQAVLGVYSNFPAPPFQSPVIMNAVWTNPAAAFTNSIFATNILTLVFATVDASAGYADGTTGKQFTWAINLAGLTFPMTITTNVTTTFAQGTSKIRLVSAGVTSVSNSQGVVLDSLKLTGWSP